jgi:GAF domain-containing protein
MALLDMSTPASKQAAYTLLQAQCQAVLHGETDPVTNMAQFAALVHQSVPGLNWAGFYRLDGPDSLLLGPFQGKVACVRIAVGNGVCGTCAQTRQAQIVPNVHDFPGHIACDSASNAELVLPVLDGDRLLAVFDLDSPHFHRFDDIDALGLGHMLHTLVKASNWNTPVPGSYA